MACGRNRFLCKLKCKAFGEFTTQTGSFKTKVKCWYCGFFVSYNFLKEMGYSTEKCFCCEKPYKTRNYKKPPAWEERKCVDDGGKNG